MVQCHSWERPQNQSLWRHRTRHYTTLCEITVLTVSTIIICGETVPFLGSYLDNDNYAIYESRIVVKLFYISSSTLIPSLQSSRVSSCAVLPDLSVSHSRPRPETFLHRHPGDTRLTAELSSAA